MILKKGYQISYYHDNVCKNYIYCYILDLIYYDGYSFLIILSNPKVLSNFWYCFFAMPVCGFGSLPNREYSNFFNAAAFSFNSFSGKTYLPVKNSFLSTSSDDKAET